MVDKDQTIAIESAAKNIFTKAMERFDRALIDEDEQAIIDCLHIFSCLGPSSLHKSTLRLGSSLADRITARARLDEEHLKSSSAAAAGGTVTNSRPQTLLLSKL